MVSFTAIITVVNRNRGLSLILAIAALCAAGCNRAPENRDAVQKAIVEHLSKNAALDMNQLNLEMGEVKFEGDQATATVAIKPKASPEQGMSMTYTLMRKGSEWQVQGKGAGHGGGMGSMPPAGGSMEMPSGHPPASGAGGSDLPPGHPPVNAPPQK